MEDLSKMAMAYYQASSEHIQKLAHDFFDAMDHDRDGKIDQTEFLKFMSDEGNIQMTNPSFFNQLDHDKNGYLDFREVMTVYYIVMSGRPFCDNCKNFITSTYLTCVGCLENPAGGLYFYLCTDCYFKQKYNHTHNGLCRFLDNYLLEAMNKSKLYEPRSMESRSRPPMSNNHTWNPPIAPTGMALVPYNRPPVAVAQPYMSNNHTWVNPTPAMVQVPGAMATAQTPYRPPIIHYNYHSSTQGAPSVTHVQNHTWIHNNYTNHNPAPRPAQHVGAPNAIVPQRQGWKDALGVLNSALQVAVVGSYLCSIL